MVKNLELNMPNVAVVIPCYRVKRHILQVINAIGPEVSTIIVVDDFCPENTGDYVKSKSLDKRLVIVKNSHNEGVGGAVMRGYSLALELGAEIIVKIDGDGQMDPANISNFIDPIIKGRADYTKGNRFYNLEDVIKMPKVRLMGNAILSFITKASSGYWQIFDPTNGYTAINSKVAYILPFHKIDSRYFFESDMLFRLNTARAVVLDVPMKAKYEDEISNLKISKVLFEFAGKHVRNLIKRIFYNYYLRDVSIASIELLVGLGCLTFGLTFGIFNWLSATQDKVPAATGTIMLAALAIILGMQFILAFISYDISSVPRLSIYSDAKFKR